MIRRVMWNGMLDQKGLFNVSNSLKMVRRNIIRRAMLYCPGSDVKKLEKCRTLKVDSLCFDMEDGVALSMKEEARKNIYDIFNEGPVSYSDPEWIVRVNSASSSELFEKDIEAVLSAKYLPPSISLPKVESVDELTLFAEKVWKKLLERPESDRGPINLMIFIESPKAIINLPQICQKAVDLSTMAPIVPTALIIGGDDLIANLGAIKTDSSVEILCARQTLVLVAKAFNLQAIDIVTTDYKNIKQLEKDSAEAAAMGFTGKQVIHPGQIDTVQETFIPSRKLIKWANALVQSFNDHEEKGQGAFVFEGKMVDMPLLRQAKYILEVAMAAGKFPTDEL